MRKLLRNPGVQYGLLGAMVFLIVEHVAPHPTGYIVLWLFLGIQLLSGSAITWIRTRLPFATAAMAIAGLTALTICWLHVSGFSVFTLPLAWAVPVWVGTLSSPLLLGVESRNHPQKWAEWRTFMERKSAWDVLLARHIPNLQRGNHRGDA